MKILAVNDDLSVLRQLDASMQGLGFSEIAYAMSGPEALRIINLAEVPFDCILLDSRMQDVKGGVLCAEIRRVPGYEMTPIIMLTCLSQDWGGDEMPACSITDYLHRPFDAADLQACLKTVGFSKRASAPTVHAVSLQDTPPDFLQPSKAFDLSEPVHIEDVPRLVSAQAMKNHLLEMDRVDMFKMGMFGFQISAAANVFAAQGPAEFHDTLTDVAECIFESTREAEPLIAYLGNGCFVAVVPRSNRLEPNALQATINTNLNGYCLDDFLESQDEIRVIVSKQFNGSLFGSDPLRIIDQVLRDVQERHDHVPTRVANRLMSLYS